MNNFYVPVKYVNDVLADLCDIEPKKDLLPKGVLSFYFESFINTREKRVAVDT